MSSVAAKESSHGTHQRVIWDLAIWVAGVVYLGLVLFENLSIPLFGVLLVVLAGRAMLEHRRDRRTGCATRFHSAKPALPEHGLDQD